MTNIEDGVYLWVKDHTWGKVHRVQTFFDRFGRKINKKLEKIPFQDLDPIQDKIAMLWDTIEELSLIPYPSFEVLTMPVIRQRWMRC